jgi:hypothetical protein
MSFRRSKRRAEASIAVVRRRPAEGVCLAESIRRLAEPKEALTSLQTSVAEYRGEVAPDVRMDAYFLKQRIGIVDAHGERRSRRVARVDHPQARQVHFER